MDKCGTCYHWMKKSDCPREAVTKPSASSWACGKYQEELWYTELKLRRLKEGTK